MRIFVGVSTVMAITPLITDPKYPGNQNKKINKCVGKNSSAKNVILFLPKKINSTVSFAKAAGGVVTDPSPTPFE